MRVRHHPPHTLLKTGEHRGLADEFPLAEPAAPRFADMRRQIQLVPHISQDIDVDEPAHIFIKPLSHHPRVGPAQAAPTVQIVLIGRTPRDMSGQPDHTRRLGDRPIIHVIGDRHRHPTQRPHPTTHTRILHPPRAMGTSGHAPTSNRWHRSKTHETAWR